MKYALALLSALALSGCAVGPKVISSNQKVVVIDSGSVPAALSESIDLANKVCSERGKVATMSMQNCNVRCITQYRCE